MDSQTIFCWMIVVDILLGFIYSVYTDFNGRSAREPGGFSGFVGSCVVLVLNAVILWGAGVLSHLVP